MKLILFDFDGVLVDTLLPCYQISKEVNEDMTLAKFQTFFEGNIYNAFIKAGFKLRPDYWVHYDQRLREIKVPPELKNIAKDLASKYTLAIISSTPKSSIVKILEKEKLSQYFQDILGTDVHTNKTLKIKMILDKYSQSSQDAVFVTDTLGDILEAMACGVRSIAVSWGFHTTEILQKGNPQKIIDKPKDLISAIEEI